MKCVDKNKLSAYLDGELGDDERGLIAEHLENCTCCRKQADDLRWGWKILDSMPGLEADVSFAAVAVAAALARQKTQRWENIFIPLIASAAAALSLVFGSFLGKVIYTEISTNSETIASSSTEQMLPSSYETYLNPQAVEYLSGMQGGN